MEHTASDRDPELGQQKTIKNETKSEGHGWQNCNALNEPRLPIEQPDPIGITAKGTGPHFTDKDGTVRNMIRNTAEGAGMDKDKYEKLISGLPAYMREYIAEYDRMLSSLCFHEEQRIPHREIEIRMSYRVYQFTAFHLLFIGAIFTACQAGYVDGRPWSPAAFAMGAETGVYCSLVMLNFLERYEHHKQGPGQFCFRLNFENLPALREFVGEQKWKELQDCLDDDLSVLMKLNDIVILPVIHRHDLHLPSGAEVSDVKVSSKNS